MNIILGSLCITIITFIVLLVFSLAMGSPFKEVDKK